MGQSIDREKRSAAVDHRLAVLGHELANVLNGACGATAMLRTSRLLPEQEQWLEAIEASFSQMGFLLLSARRPETGRDSTGPHEKQRLNGIRLLEQAIRAHAPAAENMQTRLLLSVDSGLPEYWQSVPGLLRQLLDNLVGNALKFAAGGDVTVSARALSLTALSLAVEDSGPGIDDADRARIFEPYARGRLGGNLPGSGLGLHLCRDIAHRLGGEIRCSSAPGMGARFTIDLPEALEQGSRVRQRARSFARLRCTLDLDPQLETVTGNLLDRFGVRWTRDGGECRESEDGLLAVHISSRHMPGTVGGNSLVLQAEGGDPVVEPGIVLPSALEAALLRLVLEWRWARLSRRGRPG